MMAFRRISRKTVEELPFGEETPPVWLAGPRPIPPARDSVGVRLSDACRPALAPL